MKKFTTQSDYLYEYMLSRDWVGIPTFLRLGITRFGAIFHKRKKEGRCTVEKKMKSVPHKLWEKQHQWSYRIKRDN